MEYTINITVSGQCLCLDGIQSVNGTVDIVRCAFTFEDWDDFPARQAIFKNAVNGAAYVAAIADDTCVVPWEVLKAAGNVRMALVGTNTDGQTQRTQTVVLIKQTATLQGGENSIDPTPDQYAQFIAQVAEMIGEAGVLSVNGMTGNVTLTAEDVGALSDEVTVPTKTSQLQNDSGFLTSAPVTSVNSKTGAVTLTASDVGALPSDTQIPTKTSQLTNDSGFLSSVPSEYVTETELNSALSGYATTTQLAAKANTADLATVATSGRYADLTGKPTIPTKTSDLQNDSGFLTSAPVTSVNGQTGAVTGLQTTANLVTSVSSTSTDTQYPSAKCLFDSFSTTARNALIDCFSHVAWADSQGQSLVAALALALGVNPLISISAAYTQTETVTPNTPLNDLKTDLAVTANYADSTTEVVSDYTLSGTLEVGTSVVTVSYSGKTTTFNVTVTDAPAYVTTGLIHHWDGIDNTGSGHDASAATWKDLVGSLDITTITGGTWDANGLTFSGASTQGAYASSNIETTAETTIEMVFKTTATNTQMVGSFDIYDSTTSKRFSIFSDNTIKFIGDPGNSYNIPGSALSAIDSATAVYSNFTVSKAYVNATETTLSSRSHSFKRNTGKNFVLFGNVDNTDSTKYPFTGKLMAVRVYNRALTAEEIAQNYAIDVSRFGL